MPVLPPLDAHLLRVGVPLGAAHGRRVPAGLQLPGHRVGRLSALQLRRADPLVAPALREAALAGGGRVGQRLVARVGLGRLVGGRGREVQEFAQRPQRLTLEGEERRSTSENKNVGRKHGCGLSFVPAATHRSVRVGHFLRRPVLVPVLVPVSALVPGPVAAALVTRGPGGLLEDAVHPSTGNLPHTHTLHISTYVGPCVTL